MEEHRDYLAAANIPWVDEQGRRAGFHAMWHTSGTLLSKSGVSPREAMELMRHTDLRLTMKVYTDPQVFDLSTAVEKLPILARDRADVSPAATGTDGGAVSDLRVAPATPHRQKLTSTGTPASQDTNAISRSSNSK